MAPQHRQMGPSSRKDAVSPSTARFKTSSSTAFASVSSANLNSATVNFSPPSLTPCFPPLTDPSDATVLLSVAQAIGEMLGQPPSASAIASQCELALPTGTLTLEIRLALVHRKLHHDRRRLAKRIPRFRRFRGRLLPSHLSSTRPLTSSSSTISPPPTKSSPTGAKPEAGLTYSPTPLLPPWPPLPTPPNLSLSASLTRPSLTHLPPKPPTASSSWPPGLLAKPTPKSGSDSG